MSIDRVQESLAGLLALNAGDLEQPIQLVLGHGDLLNHVQLLRVEDVQHVVKDGLQVAWVQPHLPQHRVLLLWRWHVQRCVNAPAEY